MKITNVENGFKIHIETEDEAGYLWDIMRCPYQCTLEDFYQGVSSGLNKCLRFKFELFNEIDRRIFPPIRR